VAESSGAALQGWAKKIYAKLTGEASSGTIVVKLTNADRGTILIDGQEKGNITNGSGQVGGLAEGKYKVTVESDGFRRWDRDVTVSAGQTNTLPVELEKGVIGPGGPGPGSGSGSGSGGGRGPEAGSGSGMWKGVFVGSMVVAAGGGGWWYLNSAKIKDSEDIIRKNGGYEMPSGADTDAEKEAVRKANDDGNRAKTMTIVGGVVMGVGLGVAAFAFYKGFIAKSPSSKERSSANGSRGKRVRRDRFVVTPIIAADGGGATVRLDW
jgi:hypothetical protein